MENIGKVVDIRKESARIFEKEIEYREISLKLSFKRITESRIPYNMKFMIMILVSHNIIDPYKFDEKFLYMISKAEPESMRECLELIFFNKKN